MADIHAATSTYESGTNDTYTALTDFVEAVLAAHQNGPASAIIQLQTILGAGTTLKGSAADLVSRLAVFLEADGKLKDFSASTLTTFPIPFSQGGTGATSFGTQGEAIRRHPNAANLWLETSGYSFPGPGPSVLVSTGDTQTLLNKTLTTPTIADLTNIQHDHSDAANGGTTSIGTGGLSTSTSVATVAGGTYTQSNVTMHDYSFFPSMTHGGGSSGLSGGFGLGPADTGSGSGHQVGDPGNTIGRCTIHAKALTGTNTTTIRWRYITASDMPEFWIALDDQTGETVSIWCADDPTGEAGSPIVPLLSDGRVLSAARFTAQDLKSLNIPGEHIAAAEQRIEKKKLRHEHVLYRALQMMVGDARVDYNPGSWIQENLTIKGSKLAYKEKQP